jgi:hypothetical protein
MSLRDNLRQQTQNLNTRRDARPQPVPAQRDGTGVSIGGNRLRAQSVSNEALGTGDAVVFSGDSGVVQQERRRLRRAVEVGRPVVVSGDCFSEGLIFVRRSKNNTNTTEYEWILVSPGGAKKLIHTLVIDRKISFGGKQRDCHDNFYSDRFSRYEYGFSNFLQGAAEHCLEGSSVFSSPNGQFLVISCNIGYFVEQQEFPGGGLYPGSYIVAKEFIYQIPSGTLISSKECAYYASRNFTTGVKMWRFLSGDSILYNSGYFGGTERVLFQLFTQNAANIFYPELPTINTSEFVLISLLCEIASSANRGFLWIAEGALRTLMFYKSFELRDDVGNLFDRSDQSIFYVNKGKSNLIEEGDNLSIYLVRDSVSDEFPSRFFHNLDGKLSVRINAFNFIFNHAAGQYWLVPSQGKKSNQNIVGGWNAPQTEVYLVRFKYDYLEFDDWLKNTLTTEGKKEEYLLVNMVFVPKKVCSFGSQPIEH